MTKILVLYESVFILINTKACRIYPAHYHERRSSVRIFRKCQEVHNARIDNSQIPAVSFCKPMGAEFGTPNLLCQSAE